MPKTVKDKFIERVDKEVAAWKAEDQKRLDLIENQTARVKELDAEIQRDLNSTEGATASTAAAQMNKDYAEKQIAIARHEIETHAPLYDRAAFDGMCKEIVAAHNEVLDGKLSELVTSYRQTLTIIDEIKDLHHDAGKCKRRALDACRETGTDTSFEAFGVVNPGLVVHGQSQAEDAEKALKGFIRDLEAYDRKQ